ncbi:MAG TPA: 4Fe-4S dicluster domain-containing protein [Gemmatimonadaceae bacterium]
MRRRDFLRTGAVAAGAATVGAIGAVGVAGATSAGAKTDGGPTLSISPNGELILAGAPDAPPKTLSSAEVRRGVVGRKWLMVIDLAACDGCGKCSEACVKSHFVPTDREYLRIFKMQNAADEAPFWMPRPCFHCDNPPCARVCPVGATFKRQDGIVLIDNERCIGCRFCMAACPFSARVFNWSRPNDPPAALAKGYSPEWGYPRRVGTVEKCDFCADMAREGQLPHCAGKCPMGAIYFGDENEDAVTNGKGDTARLSKLLRDRAGYRFMEELGTKPRIYYLPANDRSYPAPGEPGAKTGNPTRGAAQR